MLDLCRFKLCIRDFLCFREFLKCCLRWLCLMLLSIMIARKFYSVAVRWLYLDAVMRQGYRLVVDGHCSQLFVVFIRTYHCFGSYRCFLANLKFYYWDFINRFDWLYQYIDSKLISYPNYFHPINCYSMPLITALTLSLVYCYCLRDIIIADHYSTTNYHH